MPLLVPWILLITAAASRATALACDSLAERQGNGTTGSPSEPTSAERLEVYSCLASLGQSPINQEQAQNIWSYVKRFFGRVEDVPIECYHKMGWALAGIPADDYYNITMDNIDIVQAFGKYNSLNADQMGAVAEAVIRDWSEKVPETLSEFDLMALGQILCHFNRTDIDRIHADAYKGAAHIIGALKDCPTELIKAFASLAVQETAFGVPQSWTQFDVVNIGDVINGLTPEKYSQILEQYLTEMKKGKKDVPINAY